MTAETSRGSSAAAGKLRILQVTPTYYPAVRYGGPIRSVHGLSAALAARGHDVHVYTTNLDGPSESDVPLDRPVSLDGVKVSYFKVPALRRLYWSPAMKSQLSRTMRDFDVVHLHSIYLWPTAAAARQARRTCIPYLVSPRGMLVADVIKRKNRWIKTVWIRLVEQSTLKTSAAIHVTAPLEAAEASALGLELPDSVYIPNGIEFPQTFQALEDTPYAHVPKPYVLFLSRISWKKGLDRLVRAWRDVPEAHLVIAGNDDEGLMQKLCAMPEFAAVADRMTFVGPVSDAHKWALYQNAAAFVLPSYSENFGNVVAEAMAMSCPVVITPEVGLAKLVTDTGAGVVSLGDPSSLAAAIRNLLADSAARTQMGARGRRAVVEQLSWDAVATAMEGVYGRIVRMSV